MRDEKPLIVQDVLATVCRICGYKLFDLHVLDRLFALDPDEQEPVSLAPVFRLPELPTATAVGLPNDAALNPLQHAGTREALEEFETLDDLLQDLES